ncbi:MAG: alkaline phosphatase D family protein [Cyclobacteriaceae bacterium]
MKNPNAPKQRRNFLKKIGLGMATISLSNLPIRGVFGTIGRPFIQKKTASELFFTNGFKTAEVNSSSALLWTRLCGQQKPHPVVHQRRATVFRHPLEFDEDMPVDQMDGAVKVKEGWAKATLIHEGDQFPSDWIKATPEKDFTIQIPFDNLQPGTQYTIKWEAKTEENGPVSEVNGSFVTSPAESEEKELLFVTSTCQYFWSFDNDERGFETYDSMKKLNPDFFIHTGDYIYYDKPGPLAKNLEKAKHKWHAMNGWPSLIDFFRNTPIYMLKDDHDLLDDDAYPGSGNYGDLTFEQGLKLWELNAPTHNLPYRTFRWGKHLQVWLMEGREYRSPNPMADGPQKSIWGPTQKKWFEDTVQASDACFKLLFSPTPVVGPDRDKKTDNHANKAFETEGTWLRKFLSDQKNMFTINGDRHWQYVSVDKETGLVEFGSGPVSDAHSQGWNQDDYREEHRFLRLKGGFLSIKITKDSQNPEIIFTHHDVKGEPVNEMKFSKS